MSRIANQDPDWYDGLAVQDESEALRERVSSQAGLASFDTASRVNHEHLPRFTVRLQNGKLASYSQHEVDELAVPGANVGGWLVVRDMVLRLIRGGVDANEVTELLVLNGFYPETLNGKPWWRKR